jgi:hypothetical protein
MEAVINPLAHFGMCLGDWRALNATRPNLLLQGPDAATDGAIGALGPALGTPIHRWHADMPLPVPSGRQETLLLRDLITLTAERQTKLLRWIEATDGRVQVVSTTSVPVYPLTRRRLFLASLYYRLNVMCIDVHIAHQEAGPTMRNPASSSTSEQMTAADLKTIVRSVLLQCSVPFTDIDITSSPSAWKVVIHDQTGMVFRLPIHAGPRRVVRQAVLEAIEAEW